MIRPLLLVCLMSVGCDKSTVPLDANLGAAPAREVAGERVELTTRDDVSIVADVWLTGEVSAPGVVLLHMTPRGPWTRADWPDAFVESLHAQGVSVIRIDRRGAGESGGDATDAFEGETGRYDVEAAVKYLASNGLGKLAVVGASNGSTSLVDYAVWAEGESLPVVAAMAFMSPGSYTENQTAFADVPQVPALFQYPSNEAAWPETQQATAPESWTFTEYAGTAHGTQLFADNDATAVELQAFLVDALTD
jgi:pimeloyl-ACP methyl ester carboxylesterase